MKKLLFCLLLLLPVAGPAQTQISNILRSRDERAGLNVKVPDKIEMRTWFPDSESSLSNITYYDSAGMRIRIESDLENGIPQTVIVFTNDTARRLTLTRSMQRSGIQEQSRSEYDYDTAGNLISLITRNGKGKVTTRCMSANNEYGDPILLTLYDADGNRTGREIATYDYPAGSVISSFYNDSMQLVANNTFSANLFGKRSNAVYNDHGDLVCQPNPDDNRIYEYKYGKFGNKTQTKIFSVTVLKNGKTKRTLLSVYKYRNTY